MEEKKSEACEELGHYLVDHLAVSLALNSRHELRHHAPFVLGSCGSSSLHHFLDNDDDFVSPHLLGKVSCDDLEGRLFISNQVRPVASLKSLDAFFAALRLAADDLDDLAVVKRMHSSLLFVLALCEKDAHNGKLALVLRFERELQVIPQSVLQAHREELARTLAPLDGFLLLPYRTGLLIEPAPSHLSKYAVLLDLLDEAAEHALEAFT